MVHRRQQLARMDRVLDRGRGRLVRLPVHHTSLHPGTRHDGCVAVRPVVATIVRVAVPRRAHAADRAATKLAHSHHQRFRQQTAFVEIGNERRQTRIKHWSRLRLHPGRQSRVDVPRVIVRVRHLGPVDLNDPRPGFDQPPRQEAALAERVLAVAITRLGRFLAQVERIPRLPRQDQPERLAVVLVDRRLAHRLVERRHPRIDHIPKFRASFEPSRRDLRPQPQVIDRNPIHLGEVHVVASRIERVRVVRATEEAGIAPLADDVALLQRPRQHHERQHRLFGRLQTDDVRTEVREVGRAWRLKLPRGRHFVGRVSRQHLVDRRRVVEQPVWRVAHRPDHRELVVHPGEVGQQFSELHPRKLRIDRLEHRFDVVWHVGLRVPQVQVAGAALQVDQNDALGFSEPRTARNLLALRPGFFGLQDAAQRQTQRSRASDPNQLTTGQPIAQIPAVATRNYQHAHDLRQSAAIRSLNSSGRPVRVINSDTPIRKFLSDQV